MVYKCWPFQLLPLSSQLTGTAGEPIQLPAPGLAAFLRAWTLGLGDLGYSPGFLICSCVTLRKQFTLVSVFLSVKWRSGLPRWLRICLPSRTLGFKYWVRKILRGRKWQHTPVFFPGNYHGQRRWAGHTSLGLRRVRCDLVTNNSNKKMITRVVLPPIWAALRTHEDEKMSSNLGNSMKLSHAVWGHPRWTGHGAEV